MQAQIITVGDEILIGQIVDTNSAWLGKTLNELGIKVTEITSVEDRPKAIMDALDRAFSATDLILMTGGLGPTKDDLTKKTLAEYFGMPLVRDKATFEQLMRIMKEKGIRFNPLNQAQAEVPEGCVVIPNPNGTAPGMWFERDGKVLVSMPGVPYEMKSMVTDTLKERIVTRFKLGSIVHRTVLTYGIPESELALRLTDWENALPEYLKLAYLPNPNGIRLRLSAYEADPQSTVREIKDRFAALQQLIPGHFLGYEDTAHTLEGTVAAILTQRGETLSVAESCTGGALASRFTAMAGASGYFLGGVIAYANSVKTDLLGVDPAVLAEKGAVSREVAEQMAEGIRRATGSTYALSTTGIAGPDGGTEEKPVGTVWIALATPDGVFAEKKLFTRLREQNIARASSHAIDRLCRYLDGEKSF